jgi:hypothetical protein
MLNKEIAVKVKDRKRMELDLVTLRSFFSGVAKTRACFASLGADVIAKQLTLIDAKLFRDIRVCLCRSKAAQWPQRPMYSRHATTHIWLRCSCWCSMMNC